MKKTLIALTLATLPVAAMADVVLYGQIKAGYEASSTKNGDADRTPYANGIADFGSRIGFKGHEELGNGLKAIWQVESKTNLAGGGTTSNTNTFATRDSFIGVEGGFGKVRAGYLSNYSNSNMSDVDAWEYSNGALGLSKFTRTDRRYAGIRYDSPEFAGFDFALGFSPRDNNDADRGNPTKANYFAGLGYQNAGMYAKYQFDFLKNSAGYDKDGQVHRLEAGYDANNLFVGLGYQNAKNVQTYATEAAEAAGFDSSKALDVRGQEAAVTVGYHFGNLFPKISYAHGWDVKGTDSGSEKAANTKYDQIVLGADYDFSKRTSAMVSAGWLREGLGEDNGKAKTTAFGVGLKHKF